MCLVLAGHPFDLIKVRLQTMRVAPGQAPPYKGALDCARQTLAKEGVSVFPLDRAHWHCVSAPSVARAVATRAHTHPAPNRAAPRRMPPHAQFRGLYKGMAAPLYGVTPIFAVCFWAYDLGKQMAKSWSGKASDKQLSLLEIGLAGAFSAVPTTAIMAPGERIKVLLQVQDSAGAAAGTKKFSGPGDVVKHLVKTEGVGSLFKGSAATLLRDGSGSMAYFAVYEHIKRTLTPEGQSLSPTAVLMGTSARLHAPSPRHGSL
jgi:solute carrier family 25 carnitine/acylcarnitine transporter 20/29